MLFSSARNQRMKAQRLLVRIVNGRNKDVESHIEGPREDRRVNLTLPVWVVPLDGGKPRMADAFTTVTREVSASGMSLVVQQPFSPGEVIVALRAEGQPLYLRGRIRHVDPLGAGIWHAGVDVAEVVEPIDCPELASLTF